MNKDKIIGIVNLFDFNATILLPSKESLSIPYVNFVETIVQLCFSTNIYEIILAVSNESHYEGIAAQIKEYEKQNCNTDIISIERG